ncbi:MAG: hypothetical protein RBT11_20150, partial [Desulfobacterales bacterium]|nr:hypothetical protein [Desulfobacterales bacterium]
MIFRHITSVLAMAVCMASAVPCSGADTTAPTGTAYAMSSPAPEKTGSAQAALNEFQDPLKTPARMSALAPVTHLNAVAFAGKRVVSAGVR